MAGQLVFKAAILIFVLSAGLVANPAFLRAQSVPSYDLPTTVRVTVCGNDIVEPGEFCDNGADNKTYVSGTNELYCNMSCSGWAPMCGDGTVQPEFGEVCDRNSAPCKTADGYAGIKACNATCDGWLDCVPTEYCGDGVINGPEVCDGTTRACVTNGYSGTQSCKNDCSGWGPCVTPQSCGDGIVEGNEVCDGNSQTCTINGYNGVQTCNQTCSGWNACQTSEYCGDGIINGTEQCDGGSSCNSSCQLISKGGGGGGGGGGASSAYVAPVATNVVLQGIAYPSSTVNILQDGKLVSVTKPDSNANFKAEIDNVTPGVWTFGVWAQDRDGRKSITFSFTTLVHQNITTTISGIFLPPGRQSSS